MTIPTILENIVEHKTDEIASAKVAVPLADLKSRCADLPPTVGFKDRLLEFRATQRTAVIAEVKKGSPSKGIIRKDFDPVAIADSYHHGGAACLSVLTDERFFLGHLQYLQSIRKAVTLPLLRKDFMLDPYQIFEARAAGADAILLIAAILDLKRLRELADAAAEIGLDVLLEVHDEDELSLALQTSVTLIGINNRNLNTFVTDIGTTERLIPSIPSDRLVVSESGINSRNDILRLETAGASAFLIGESLMREPDPGLKLKEFLGDH